MALSNKAHLANSDFRGPRVDWRDLEEHSAGQLICLTGGPSVGVLTPLIERAPDLSNPSEAVALARRLNELYLHVYVELAYHGHSREKLVNRGLVALAQRLDLPVVATNAVRFARARDALAHQVLGAMARGRVAEGVVRNTDPDSDDAPINHDVEHEVTRWLAVHPRADAAAGFRAGCARLARFVRPKLREWEARWWRMARENDRLRARLGVALREISRLTDRG